MASTSRGKLIRRILYVLVGFVIVGFLVSRVFNKKPGPEYTTTKVTRGDIAQTVGLTGTTEARIRSQLQFPISGRVRNILVKAGDHVNAGDVLATLEGDDLGIQVVAQKAAVRIAQANLIKAVAGPKNEEIQLGQSKIDSANTTLNHAIANQNNLLDLSRKVVDAASIARSQAQAKYNQAQWQVNFIANNSSIGRNLYYIATNSTQELQAEQDRLNQTQSLENAQNALADAELNLKQAQTSYDKAVLDYNRQFDDAQNAVDQAQIGTQTAQEQLNLTQAPQRDVDVDPLKAQIDQAFANLNLAEYRFEQGQLRAPEDGIITKINYHSGENISPAQPFLTLDTTDYLIKVLAPESDIAKINVGNEVTIDSFDALSPDQHFSGTVSEISPAETVVQGVVYYEVKIQFNPKTAPIKAGMSANLTIKTATNSDVYIIPVRAVQYENSKPYVQVLTKDDKGNQVASQRKVILGLEDDQNVRVLLGLKEGEEVVTFTKTP